MKLLIVDDHALNLKLLRAQLEAEGFAVEQAFNGVEALRVLAAVACDGVISDILMPEMDGFRLCLEVRKDARLARLPFLLYTSTYNSPSDRELARTVGADAYLTKPAPVKVILQALGDARERQAARETPIAPMADEGQVLRQYNQALVNKLEEKNHELAMANGLLVALNESLERRVQQRTFELEVANRDLEATNRGLEAFSYSVSHDLRAPLRVIDGYAMLLLEDYAQALPDEAKHFLGLMRNGAQRMSTLIEDLLRFAKTAQQPLEMRPVDLGALVAHCLAEFRDEIAARRIEVSVQPLPQLQADEAMLRQVFVNLLGNAVKYTRKQEHPAIEVGCRSSEGECVVHVKDNGAGFDMRYADKLFNVFQRLHRQDEFEGSGVGLAIVQRIVQRHGGRIWAEAVPGRGASFFVSLQAGMH